MLALRRAHQAGAHLAIERSVLSLCGVSDPVESPSPHLARQAIVILADLIEESALMQRVEQAEAHPLVERGARDHIAQAQYVARRLEGLEHSRCVDQALDQIPAMVGSLHRDPDLVLNSKTLR